MQKYLSFLKPLLVPRINDKYDSMDLIEIVLPEPCCLTTHVPQSEIVIFVLDLLYIQSNSWHCVLVLIVSHLEQ